VKADLSQLFAAATHWLGAGAVDGAIFAGLVWIASATWLKRSSGRVLAWVWSAALLKFVVIQPFEMHALTVRAGVYRAIELHSLADRYAWVAGLYSLLVVLLLARLVVRQRRLTRSVSSYAAAEPGLLARVRKAADALGLGTLPAVRVSDALGTPYAVGPWCPTLVLPRWLCTPGERLDAVLLHELAHLQRRDHWFLWLERVVASFFFFWPPVHWVNGRLDEARELACDELAIRRGGISASDYVRHLVDVIAGASRGPVGLDDALAIGRSSWRLERRVDHLLNEAWSQRSSGLQRAGLAVLTAAALLAVRPVHDVQRSQRAPISLSLRAGDGAPLMSEIDGLGPGCVVQSCGTVVCSP
jgi:beta-lactamase regulating signal transducer with metallopeptidase domain